MSANTDSQLNALSEESNTILQQAREMLARIEESREEQPTKLAAVRAETDNARSDALAAEPWAECWSALPLHDPATGEMTGLMALPSIDGKELWGARAAFDFLDAGADSERIDECMNRYFTALEGNTEHLFLVFAAALTTISEHVVPMMLDNLESHASDYVSRVLLAEGARNAWKTRARGLWERFCQEDTAAEGADDE